jgi:bifunctional non-homologous end joining protein LigD
LGLTRYEQKRDFARTPEPAPAPRLPSSVRTRRFVVQKHDATRLHFDVRLELDGVLKSWAVPKGPSLDPADKRLAVHTEDHPLEYADFEGVIPEGEYGGGPSMIWDEGTWTPQKDPHEGYTSGKLEFALHGHRLRGGWALVRTRPKQPTDKETWLLVKEVDACVATPGDVLVQTRTTSIRTRRTFEDILAGRDPPILDAPPGPLPAFVPPALATAVDHAPEGASWRHEMKLDGYRALVRVEGRTVRILTRSGLDWTDKFGPIAKAAATLPVTAALLDGEIVVLDAEGRSDFGKLVGALEQGRPESLTGNPSRRPLDASGAGRAPASVTGLGPAPSAGTQPASGYASAGSVREFRAGSERLVYYAFDLLHLDGHDLRGLPLSRRCVILAEVLRDALPPIRLVEQVEGNGTLFHRAACEHGLEGIVSKRPDAPYRSGRGRGWLKVRCGQRQEFVIVGWTDPAGSRTGLGALLAAYRDGETWRFAGRVGTGFDEATLTSLRARLQPTERPTPPVVDPPTGAEARGCHWVEPTLVAEVKFTGWTPYQRLRHPVFLGIREDKRPEEVRLEVPMKEELVEQEAAEAPAETPTAPPPRPEGVRLTNPDRVLWPPARGGEGVTKRALAEYLDRVADRMLPEIARRPLTLVRCPSGQDAGCFYQRHVTEGLPEGFQGVRVPGHGDNQPYLWVDDRAGLVGVAQIGGLEIHPWGVRIDDLDRPDRLIFDLDPGPGVPWAQLVEVAGRVHDRLAALGLRSFAKVTGGKGIHVVVPLRPHAPWEVAKPFCRLVAEALAKADPETVTAKMAKTSRERRVYLDWLRNTSTSTAVAAWSPRARPGAPIAVPVGWDALAAVGSGDCYTLHALLHELPPDPWGPLDAVDQRLDADVLQRLGV